MLFRINRFSCPSVWDVVPLEVCNTSLLGIAWSQLQNQLGKYLLLQIHKQWQLGAISSGAAHSRFWTSDCVCPKGSPQPRNVCRILRTQQRWRDGVSSCSTNPGWEFLSSPLRCAKEARDNWMLTERLTLRDNRGWFYYPGVNHTGNAGMPCILEGKFLSSLFCLLMPLKRKHVTSLGHRPLVFQAPEFCLE